MTKILLDIQNDLQSFSDNMQTRVQDLAHKVQVVVNWCMDMAAIFNLPPPVSLSFTFGCVKRAMRALAKLLSVGGFSSSNMVSIFFVKVRATTRPILREDGTLVS